MKKCICIYMVVSRCRGIGPPSGIPSSGLCFCWPPTTSSSNAWPPVSQFLLFVLVWPVPRGVSVIPRAVFLACFYKSIYRHLGTPPRSTVLYTRKCIIDMIYIWSAKRSPPHHLGTHRWGSVGVNPFPSIYILIDR